MWAQLVALSFLFLTRHDHCCTVDITRFYIIPNDSSCKTEIDSLTKNRAYITADIPPANEGEQVALMNQFKKIEIKTFPTDYDPNFLVAFIVGTNGKIKGEKILRDKTNIA